MRHPSTEQIADVFDRAAADYDRQIGWFERAVLGSARAWAARQARGRVVEIGIGTGLNLPLYGTEVSTLVGVDLSARMLDIARDRATTVSAENVELRCGDAQSLDIDEASVDTVVSTFTFCTIPDPQRASDEAFRVLVPGGRFVLAEHGPSTSAIGRALMGLVEPLTVRFGADHLLRDPIPYLTAAGFDIEHCGRGGRGGVTFRVLARKPL